LKASHVFIFEKAHVAGILLPSRSPEGIPYLDNRITLNNKQSDDFKHAHPYLLACVFYPPDVLLYAHQTYASAYYFYSRLIIPLSTSYYSTLRFFLLLLLAQELADARRALSERLSSLEREESSRLGSNHRLYQPFAKLFGSMITIMPTIPVNER